MKKGKVLYQAPDMTPEEKAEWDKISEEFHEAQERVKEKLARGEEVPTFRYDKEDLSALFQTEDDED